jgi:hypothetical protein
VAVNVETGKRVWHFQTVHHSVWDYDLPAAPTLLDLTVRGTRVKAIAQISKQGFTYVFDRVNGRPLWPIEERPVPKSDIPGEELSPTQPFPTRPPAFEYQGVTDDLLIDFTPALKDEARESRVDTFTACSTRRSHCGRKARLTARCSCRASTAARTGADRAPIPKQVISTFRRAAA